MTAWISIEHAPKDRPVDLWGRNGDRVGRWADCRWLPAPPSNNPSYRPSSSGSWYYLSGEIWGLVEPTHYMEIPEGPK